MDLVSKPKVKSAIWVHFGFKPNEKGEPQNIDEAVCRLCRRIVFVKGGNTSNLRHHLRLRHPDIFSEFISATSGHGYYFEPSGSEQSHHYNNDNGSQGNFGSGHGNFGSGHGNFGGGHGNDRPLHFIPDMVVCGEPWLEGGDPRAVGSIPPCLSLRRWGSGPVPGGSAEEEEAGVFAKTLSLHQGWTFGPFVGELTRGPLSCLKYAWAIKENDSYYFVDASDENKSNWMRYVACAACEEEHNLTVFQYRGQIFYRVSQPIPEGTELKVWIGQEYAAMLGLGIGENIKCEFGDKEILLRIFRDIQVVPVGGTSSLPDANASYSWSDNSQSGSPLPVISDVSSGLQTDTTDPTPVLNPPQNTNQTGLATTVKYDFVKGAEILLSPSQPNSPVWEFFGFEPDPNGQPLDKDKVMCKLCGQQVDYSATVTQLENHLVQMHHMKRRDVIKDGNKPWVSSSRFRPYPTTGGRAPRSSSPSTHRPTNSNYSNEDWTWSGNGSSAVTDTVTAGSTATPGQRTLSNFLTNQTTTAITNFLIKDLLPPGTVEGEGFKQLIQTLLPSCKEIPSASLLEEVLRDVHTEGRKTWAKLLTNSTGFNEEDTSKPNIPVQFKPSSSTRKAARFHSQTQNQVSHHVAVSADVWCHDWQGDQERYATLWAHFINADFTSHNLALATQRLGETGTGDMDLSVVEATVRSVAQEWDISQPSFILLGGEEMEKTKVGAKKRERSGEGVGGGARHHHPNSTTFLEMEDSISSDDLSGLERAIERANSTSEESHSPPIPCFFTAVQSCIEEVMSHSIISKTLSVFQHLLYSLFSLHHKDMVTLHPARKLIVVLQKQETAELKAWAYGKPGWNGLYSVVKTLLRYQNMISETLKQIDSEIQTGQDTGSPTDLDSGATAALKTADKHDTNSTSAGRANSDTTDSSNSSVPVPPKRSDWKVLEDLSSLLKPLDVACCTLAKEPFPKLSLVKPILTGLLDRHFAPHPRHRNDSTILKELKKKIRWGLSRRYNDPQINQVLCVACALDPQFHGLGFMDVREQATTFAWLKKEVVRIVEEDRRRAEAASPGGRKRKKRGSSSTTSSGEMEGDVLRRSKRLKEITPVSFKERTESDSDEEATDSSVNNDSESDNMEPKLEPTSQQTGMEFLLGDLFGSQSQNKQPSVEETVDIELSVFRAEKGATLGVEPLQWWKARSGQLPLLAKVARAYLAAPAVAGSAVQMFLQDGGGVIQRKRTNIPPEGLDQMLFLHHNGLTATTQGYTTV
ncbi:uncharacterized protein LOC116372120 isoform X2 [Oncorhynchus kisutch]|uniref:Uncharacterized LOC116372120 n=1 Tax=Oncorhynchus kisutch TaxID=8019 RepID=A0A8C7L3N1_ONCKI|nr:uncharacterized protein LOC116372120 isoform X2 [Oncorhynchus kisutch]